MENISDKLQALLSDEEGIKQLQSLYEILSGEKKKDKEDDVSENENISAEDSSCTENEESQEDDFDFSTFFRLQSLLDAGNTENKNTALIVALKPYLSYDKQMRADKAIKILNIIEAAAVLRESGLLNNIL
ncbi:MAG: hypothetical protein PUE12_03685 [Oscillospiraceae bacterium]|nr:hypothetical protein [Oscillospiraceae bacterium]